MNLISSLLKTLKCALRRNLEAVTIVRLAFALLLSMGGKVSGTDAGSPIRFLTNTDALAFTNGALRLQMVDVAGPPMALVVEASSNLVNWVGIYTNLYPATSQMFVDLDASNQTHRFYRAVSRAPLLRYGLAAKTLIDLKGNNLTTDSFDSSDPNGSTNGQYDSSKARGHGDVAAYFGITNSVSIGNATIHGGVATGPHGSVSMGPGGLVSGTITDDMNVAFNDVTVPFQGGGYYTAANRFNTNENGTTYSQVFDGGNYRISPVTQWSLSGLTKVLIRGEVSIWLPKGFAMSGNAQIEIAPTGRLAIYTGADSSISGGGLLNIQDATKCMIWGLSTCSNLFCGGNAAFTGTVYAPSADLFLSGGGGTNYEFQGASVTKSVTLSSRLNFHYDENLQWFGLVR